jgi:hypothetical protein
MGAAREHGIIDALAAAGVQVVTDTATAAPDPGSTCPSDVVELTRDRAAPAFVTSSARG